MINHPTLTRCFFSIPNSEVCCWRTHTWHAPKFGDMSSMKIISLTRLHYHLEVVNYHTRWGPQSIAFSWFISGLIVVYGRYNELVHGDYISCFINQCSHHWGAPSCTYHVKKNNPTSPTILSSVKVVKSHSNLRGAQFGPWGPWKNLTQTDQLPGFLEENQ